MATAQELFRDKQKNRRLAVFLLAGPLLHTH